MKTRLFIATAMLMMSTASFAQFTNSGSADIGDYNTVYLQWNPSSIVPDEGDSKSFNGFSAGYNHAFSLSRSIPLYVEAGLGAQFSIWSDDIKYKGVKLDEKLHILSAKIPISLAYKWDIPNSSISIIPNVGLDFRFNILGKFKLEADGESKSYDLFDKDDMEKVGEFLVGDKDTWSRFQVGWHAGVNFMINNSFTIGASYGTDFSEIAKKTKIHTGSITLGYCF